MAGIICAGFVYSPIPFGLRHICASCGYHKDRHSTALAPIVKAAPADAPATERDLYDDLSDALDKVRTIPAAVPAPPVALPTERVQELIASREYSVRLDDTQRAYVDTTQALRELLSLRDWVARRQMER